LEHGRRTGRLAGFELEPGERRIRRIIFSPDGELGPQAMTRPLSAVATARKGEIELSSADLAALPPGRDVVLLSRATRFVAGKQDRGRLAGVDVDPANGHLVSAFGRAHWWSRRETVSGADVDCGTPGELRTPASGTRAA